MSDTVRLTMAQALVRFLDCQYVEVDGVESKFVAGIFGISNFLQSAGTLKSSSSRGLVSISLTTVSDVTLPAASFVTILYGYPGSLSPPVQAEAGLLGIDLNVSARLTSGAIPFTNQSSVVPWSVFTVHCSAS